MAVLYQYFSITHKREKRKHKYDGDLDLMLVTSKGISSRITKRFKKANKNQSNT